MADQTTNVTNGAESTLSSTLSAGATTVNVTSTTAFPSVPFYAVIDPDVDATREIILVDSSKTATTFVLSGASKRGVDGTTDTEHSSGAKVVCVPVAALWTDINDRVDAVSTTADAALTPAEGDAAYAAKLASGSAGPSSDTVSALSTWEQWSTQTVTLPQPAEGRSVAVIAWLEGNAFSSVTSTIAPSSRVAISIDGGATFTTGQAPQGNVSGSVVRCLQSASHRVSDVPTGDIVVKAEINQAGGTAGDVTWVNGSLIGLMI